MMASHRQWRHIIDLVTHETAGGVADGLQIREGAGETYVVRLGKQGSGLPVRVDLVRDRR
ncbi:hypothetical protein GTZ78_09545 [Streptomyces sp. SID8361]|uniref:hypothetical protein n=1 Tax=Streptomyces sp. MnatMP-M27 TaxID=1839768 RepID=UPI00081EE586|nr:hypothetical protein [Streptomyces sp. MnatMP-M27]MYU10930.1 hypothetical protein [Streptomyces sp. SID8361]SCF76612.1 hypothetical protein GA0115260_102285 [Streptomyces sp. MnatMP-M27]